ncbi:MAG: hypothetical protein P9L99_21405 [Candidatus Lernaella stagnicola]|nr:hypothetical protein [Candidatus Lernaella stagnicola]
MKKALWLILALLMVVSVSCDTDKDDDEGGDDDTTPVDDDDDNDDNNNDDNDDNDDDTAGDDDDDDDNDDDDNDNDDDDDNDTFVAPSPVYGYYQEGYPGNWAWLEQQLPILAEYNLALFLGMDSVDLGNPTLLNLLRAAEAQGVEVRAWLLLPYSSGYWPGELNAEEFAATALDFAAWFLEEEVAVEWIVVDMETDVNLMGQINALLDEGKYFEVALLLLDQVSPEQFDLASQVYQQMVDDLYGLGFYSMVVTAPMFLDDVPDGDTFLQDAMNIPVSTVRWHEVSTMVYTTTFEEYLGLPFGAHIVYDYAATTVEYYPNTASIALGLSHQMLEPAELAQEIAAAKAAGVERIQVYSYNCTLAHPNPEDWHATFTTPAQTPPWEPSTILMRGALSLADWLF